MPFNAAKCKAVHYVNTQFDTTYQMKDNTGQLKDLPFK